jgi:FtsH-binding integral membrane protein
MARLDLDPSTDSNRPAEQATASSRSRAVRVGFALFAVGLVFLVCTVIPFFFDDHNRSLWLNLGCMLAPLGFVIAVIGAIRAGRADQQAAADALDASKR